MIHYGFIGCGRVAARHAEALSKDSNSKLVAVADIDVERSNELANSNGVKGYTNYHDMLTAHPEIDVVSVITPSGSHFEHAMDVVSHYQKHVVIEKPMVMRIDQANELKAEADKHGVQIFPIYQNRFNTAVQFVRNAMQPGGDLGALRVGTVRMRWCRPQRYYDQSVWRGNYAMDGGALTNQGIHYIDLLRYICGEVKRVNAITATLGADIEVEDTAVATLEFESGALGVLEIMTSARHDDFEASISCVCEEGLGVIGGIAANEVATFSPDQNRAAEGSAHFPTVYGFGHDVFYERTTNALLNGDQPPIEFDDGLTTLKLLHAIYKSAEIGDWVEIASTGNSARLGVPNEELLKLYRTPKP